MANIYERCVNLFFLTDIQRWWLLCPQLGSGFPVLHHLPEFAQTHVWLNPTISSSILRFSSFLQSFPAWGSFPMSGFFTSGGWSIEISASASDLPMNIQGWFSLRLASLISLLSKRLSRSPAPQFKSINSLAFSLLYGPALISIHDYWKKP